MASNWVFLRGLVRESRHWEGFPEVFKESVRDVYVHPVDFPGVGLNFDKKCPATIAGIMEQVRSSYRRRLNDSDHPLFVVAISMGAMVTAEWMTKYPGEIQGAVLMNTSFSNLSPFYERLNPSSYTDLLEIFLKSDPLEREKTLLSRTTNLTANTEEVAERWAEYHNEYPMSKANTLRQLKAAATYKLPKEKPDSKILVLAGARDRLVDPKCSIEFAKRWGAEFDHHPNAGHDLTLDAADWVGQRIAAWFAKHWPELTPQEEIGSVPG